MSKAKVSASLRVPNTEIQMKARGRKFLEPVMKHEPRQVFLNETIKMKVFDLRWKPCFNSDENLVVFYLVFH